MKILLKVQKSPAQFFLVGLSNKKMIARIKGLVKQGKYSKAMLTVLAEGDSFQKITEQNIPQIHADIILTNKNAHWNLIA